MSKKSKVGRGVPGRMQQPIVRPNGSGKTEAPTSVQPQPVVAEESILVTPEGTEIVDVSDLASDVDFHLTKASEKEMLLVQIFSLHQRLLDAKGENAKLQQKINQLELDVAVQQQRAFLRENGLAEGRKMKTDTAGNWWWIDVPAPTGTTPGNGAGEKAEQPTPRATADPAEKIEKPAEPAK